MKALLCLLYICVAGVAATGQQAFASSVTSSASTGKHAVTSTAGKAQSTSASTAGDASSLSTTASTQSTTQITSSSARSTSASTTVAATTGGTHYQPAGDPCTGVNIVTTRKGAYIPPYAPIGQRYGLQVFHFNGQGRNMLLAGALVQGSDPIPVRSVLADIQAVTTEFSCDYYEHDLWWSWSELMASGLNSAVVPVGGKTGTTFTYDYTGMVACALGSSTAPFNPLYLWKTYDPTTLVTAIHVNSPTTVGDRVVVEIPLAGVITSAYELRDATYWTEKLYLLWANEMCLNWATHRSFGNYTLGSVASRPLVGNVNNQPISGSSYAGTVSVWWEQLNTDQLGVMATSDIVTSEASTSIPVVLARVPYQAPLAASYYNASLLQMQIFNAITNLYAQMVLVAGGEAVVMENLLQEPRVQEKILAWSKRPVMAEAPPYREEAQALFEAHRAAMLQPKSWHPHKEPQVKAAPRASIQDPWS